MIYNPNLFKEIFLALVPNFAAMLAKAIHRLVTVFFSELASILYIDTFEFLNIDIFSIFEFLILFYILLGCGRASRLHGKIEI